LFFLVFAALAMAQQPPTLDLVHGELLETEGLEFAVRSDDYRVHRFRVDDQTFVERDQQRVKLPELLAGDIIDVVTDRTIPPAGPRYARLVKVSKARLEAKTTPTPSSRFRYSDYPNSILLSRGAQTFSGIITRMRDSRIVLRTRSGEERMFRLRGDTIFRNAGRSVSASDVVMQSPVFIRAGRSIENELEAYEVMWGEILKPDAVR
jgi:hypothetical protein